MLSIFLIVCMGVALHSCKELSQNHETLWSSKSFDEHYRWHPNWRTLRTQGFKYDDPNGADTWGMQWSDCDGKSQSPINIDTATLQYRKPRYPLIWRHFDSMPKELQMENTGHSVQLSGVWENGQHPYIQGGPLRERYYFSQLHFHWGRNNSAGSEHTINGRRYTLELHVVHQTKATENRHSPSPGKLAVVGYMFQLGLHNPDFDKIWEAIPQVSGATSLTESVEPHTLEYLTGEEKDYVTYDGSLTTPPCSEGVTWFISSKVLTISKDQMDTIRKSIILDDGECMQNFRPTQDPNGRTPIYVRI